jgi:predicted RNase H-like nuclease (RuvC/YqgF family)
MVEKHIGRKDSKGGKDDEDEWSHITETGPKLDSIDPLAVVARTIVFGKELNDAAKEVIVKEKSQEFKDQMNNTNQYLKFINAHLAESKSKVQKLKEDERRFKEELDSLQDGTIKSRPELDKVNYKYINENDTRSLLSHLEVERQVLREKLVHQQEQLEKTRQQILEKDEQMKHVQIELETLKKTPVENDPIAVLREELAKLGIQDGSAKILDAVNSIASMINSKKTDSY